MAVHVGHLGGRCLRLVPGWRLPANCPIQTNVSTRFTGRRGFVANRDETSQKLVTKRKALWKHNTIQTNRANLPLLDSKAASRKIAKNRNVNANSASAKNKVAAANKVADVSKADDNLVAVDLMSGGRRLPPLLCLSTSKIIRLCPDTFLIEEEGNPYVSDASRKLRRARRDFHYGALGHSPRTAVIRVALTMQLSWSYVLLDGRSPHLGD
jgi:hypothetical protein